MGLLPTFWVCLDFFMYRWCAVCRQKIVTRPQGSLLSSNIISLFPSVHPTLRPHHAPHTPSLSTPPIPQNTLQQGNSSSRDTARGAVRPLRSFQVSRLMVLPNLAYRSTLSCVISSRMVSSLSSSSLISSSRRAVESPSSSCACGSGRWKKASPILYLSVGGWC